MSRALLVTGDLSNFGDALIAIIESEILLKKYDRVFLFAKKTATWTEGEISGIKLGERLKVFGLDEFPLFSAHDLMVVGGGNMIRDGVGLSWVVKVISSAIITRASGGKLVLFSIGNSKVTSWLRKVVFRILFFLSNKVLFRDSASLMNAKLLSKKRALSVANEIVLSNSKLIKNKFPKRSESAFVVNVFSDSYESRVLNEDAVCKLIYRILVENDLIENYHEISLVSHEERKEFDERFLLALKTKLASEYGLFSKMIPYESVVNTMEVYRGCGYVVTNRLHSAILGEIYGAKVHAILDDSMKLNGWAFALDWKIHDLSGSGSDNSSIEDFYISGNESCDFFKQITI
ncbi:polysaccharide pyruvyl transferase family protein [Microbulbifer sp. MCCC 1A16149]|uniref:polysaccharide pyruvyl transferase family protein n=1 Tax=Microbulbifer sp. MCCC 1A16149 TaxID=3411322 RepID=UPI003D13259F